MEPSKPTNFAQDRRRYLDTLIAVIPVGPWCALLFAWSAAVAIPAMAIEDEKHESEITPQALCPATPSDHKENSIGCPESVLDADNDGIADHQDQCLNSVAIICIKDQHICFIYCWGNRGCARGEFY